MDGVVMQATDVIMVKTKHNKDGSSVNVYTRPILAELSWSRE
jgi:hypothetical protein